jgi:uncharacterized protein (TIGR02246 family)
MLTPFDNAAGKALESTAWLPRVSGREGKMSRSQYNHEDEEAIKKVIMEMTDAFNEHDAKRLAQVYTANADLVNVYGTWLNGAAAIEKGLSAMFENIIKGATLKTLDIKIRFINPGVAIGHVTNELREEAGPNGQKTPPQHERSLRIFVKDSSKWQVAAFHNTIVERFTT